MAAYLLDEVIDRLAPELLDFLVRVSILDVVSPDLADALTGAASGAAMLTDLAASNLFVHAVGAGGRWYRLHRLMADVLRTRISQPRTLRDLHRRAAQWYLGQAMPLDAVRYALRGGLWPLAAEVLGRYVLALVIRGSSRDVELLLSAVPRDVLLAHPELAAALAAARMVHGPPAEVGAGRRGPRGSGASPCAARGPAPRRPAPGRGGTRPGQGGPRRGRRRLPSDPRGSRRPCRAGPRRMGCGTAAVSCPTPVRPSSGPVTMSPRRSTCAPRWTSTRPAGMLRPHLNAAAHLALLRCERGDLHAAHDDAHAVVEHATALGWTVSAQVAAAYLALARVALDRDETSEVDDWLARVAEVEALIPEPHVQLAAAVVAALLRADAGDLEDALATLRLTMTRLGSSVPPALADRLLQVEAELLRRAGDLERACAVLAGLRQPATAAAARAVAHLHLCKGDLAAADEALAPFPDDGATVRGRVEGAVLRSLIAARHDHAAGLSRLEGALIAAAPVRMRRPFLVHAAELQDLLSARIEAGTAAAAYAVDLVRRMAGQPSRPPSIQATALTNREQLVLRYLASTMSNTEIASELYLSVNTIKTHQRMVYRKLGADGRRDAVRRAKELRLL